MRAIRPGLILFFVQLFLVLSVAGKYLYERQTRPRVWVRTAQHDPSLPLRGRYLALQPVLDACALPRNAAQSFPPYYRGPLSYSWHVSLIVQNGKLVPVVNARSGQMLTLNASRPCDRATLNSQEMLFIPDRAQLPLPVKPGQELWV